MTGARLACRRCRAERPLAACFHGCAACARPGDRAPLEVAHDLATLRAAGLLATWRARPGGLWRFRELLPLPDGAEPVTLEEGATPLVRLVHDGPGRIWLKDETRNPTGAFKDRLHAVALSMARVLGFRKATAATTGNHGTALAAYAARAGLAALVFCDPRAPGVQRRLMQLFGARVAVLPERGAHLAWLVAERGWYPSTGMTPDPVANPYGVEGYKTIGFEIFFQLGERFPGRVLVPTSGGDALYGPWKGFRELAALGAPGSPPRMVAVQAAGCDPIVQGFRAGASTVPVHPAPRTIAVSIADETGGPISLAAIRESGGSAVAVDDGAIVAAMRALARQGIAVEPSSAAPVAAALAAAGRGELGVDEDVVCVLTGAGGKWPDALLEALEPRELRDATPAAVRAWIEAADREAGG
jgi:threonine synthase